MPIPLQHNIIPLPGSVLVGAVTSAGDLIAVLEDSGIVKLLRLYRGIDGGLCCEDSVLELGKRLSSQDKAHATSLRFQESPGGLRIFAVDKWGRLITRTLTETPDPPLSVSQILELPG
jgi:hypothetical protein